MFMNVIGWKQHGSQFVFKICFVMLMMNPLFLKLFGKDSFIWRWRHDIQYKDTHYNDTLDKDTQYYDTLNNGIQDNDTRRNIKIVTLGIKVY